MTRFARAGNAKKIPHDGTEWKDMFGSGSESKQKSDSVSKTQGKKHDKKFKKFKKDKMNKKVKGIGKNIKVDEQKPWQVNSTTGDKMKERAMRNQFFRDKKSEQRRVQRKDDRDRYLVCFNCRKHGHRMGDCPQTKGSSSHGTGICFKCGSTEHVSSACSAKVAPENYPFAKCFICGEMGHITRQCPDNPRGLYPNGGCCNECGSVEHLKKDCPDLQKQRGIETVTIDKMSNTQSADTELDTSPQPPPKKKKGGHGGTKIVKF
ncbi:zinc finger CCHC domain-containing protein 9-like isoform X1 [Haliotis rufescens]|uniref:zinc finger CCHC domain-containing protein 9-like isoform X1 n=1 Tax=Haliotis rufescens TaxID=6454 RepID=UPI00201F0F0E|nr:zinc finger CCHC domain-containing protein 9-like isoform X1 [Haliotis rufescens]XP_048251766.1 zinc finger CCHC domain-containing protein 9-like isoform X1 [Haliotis rufescens]